MPFQAKEELSYGNYYRWRDRGKRISGSMQQQQESNTKDRTDMAMIYSEVPCRVAGTFTTNVVKAAPVKWDQDIVYNQLTMRRLLICQ